MFINLFTFRLSIRPCEKPTNCPNRRARTIYRLHRCNQVANLTKEEKGQRFSSHRWTTGLALGGARRLEELFLETEPEWRLFKDLKAMGISFQLNPGPDKLIDPDNPSGRVLFKLDECNIRYAGSSGYVIKLMEKRATSKMIMNWLRIVPQ